jgi:hypothetical protein
MNYPPFISGLANLSLCCGHAMSDTEAAFVAFDKDH